MATVKKQIYINAELDWANQKLQEWKDYVDDNPFQGMSDRITMKSTKTGAMPIVVASIESQIKCVRDTMKEYLVLLEQVDKMRQLQEHKNKEVKGGAERPSRMMGN